MANDRQKFLKSLKVGDKVAIINHHWSQQNYVTRVIAGETPTQFKFADGIKFRKDDGHIIGASKFRYIVSVADAVDLFG